MRWVSIFFVLSEVNWDEVEHGGGGMKTLRQPVFYNYEKLTASIKTPLNK